MFTYTRKAQYHETDKMGIIHHSNYIQWMEEARIAFMDSLGFGYAKVEELGMASPVAGITISYKHPVRFDETVDVKVSISRYSGVVQEISYEITNRTTGQLAAVATSKHCYIKDGGVVNLKHALPELDAVFEAASKAAPN